MTQTLSQALTQVAKCWLDGQYVLRQQARALAAAEFCLSPASFELALDWIFSQWTEEKITDIIVKNPFKDSRYAVQILAGNTPAVIAQGLLQAAILNIPQCIKIPSKQPTFARLLYQSFMENSVSSAALLELIVEHEQLPRLYSQLRQADLVFAYGQDETITAIKKYLAPNATFIAHGQADSAAVIFKEAAKLNSLEKLAYDFLSYDQRGCLSPRITFIEQGGELSPAECARVFAEKVLPELATQLPRGGLFAGEAAEILHQRNLCGFRGQVYCGEDWTVSYAEKQPWPATALPRFILFTSFETTPALITLLKPRNKYLISLGYAGPEEKVNLLKPILAAGFCALGEMQKQLLIF